MTRLSRSICDAVGLITLSLAIVGCIPLAQMRSDLRPLVAACGAYALAAPETPKPPAVCRTCGGKKVLGDGTIKIPCPDCTPKKESERCQTGSCLIHPPVIVR